MKFFVTGVCGQLGYDVCCELIKRGYSVFGTDLLPYEQIAGGFPLSAAFYCSLDLTEEEACKACVAEQKPDVIIHCAAWTAVDQAEEEPNRVEKINVDATRFLAEAAKESDAKMLYISTDYVFSGEGTAPWKPDCKEFCPQNVYGKTKLAGEQAVSDILQKYFIVRIAWVFGLHGNNFVKTILRVGKTHAEVRVVNDQIGTPTYTFDLARLLADMAETEKYGYYHATNEGAYISWYDFTEEIYRQYGLDTKVIPVTTKEYGASKAKRPMNSRLDKTKLTEQGFAPLPHWKAALRRYLEEAKL